MRHFSMNKVNDIACSASILTPSDKPSGAKGRVGVLRNGETSYEYYPVDYLNTCGSNDSISDDDFHGQSRLARFAVSSSQSLSSESTAAHRSPSSCSRVSRQKTIDKRTTDSVHLIESLRGSEFIQTATHDEDKKHKSRDRIFSSFSRYSISLSNSSKLSGDSTCVSHSHDHMISDKNCETTGSVTAEEQYREKRRDREIAVRNLTALYDTLIALSSHAQDRCSAAERSAEVAEIARVIEGVSVRTARKKGIFSIAIPPRGRDGGSEIDTQNVLQEDEAITEGSISVSSGQRKEPLLQWLNRCLACEPRDAHVLNVYQSYQPWLAFVPSLVFIIVMLAIAALFVTIIR